MKHTFKIVYETDGLPICPDAIHKQLDQAMVNIRKKFEKQYYMLPGLHKLTLEPCGDWFPDEQKPMRFKAASHKPQAASAKLQEGIDYEVDNIDDYIKRVKSNKRLETDTIKK